MRLYHVNLGSRHSQRPFHARRLERPTCFFVPRIGLAMPMATVREASCQDEHGLHEGRQDSGLDRETGLGVRTRCLEHGGRSSAHDRVRGRDGQSQGAGEGGVGDGGRARARRGRSRRAPPGGWRWELIKASTENDRQTARSERSTYDTLADPSLHIHSAVDNSARLFNSDASSVSNKRAISVQLHISRLP